MHLFIYSNKYRFKQGASEASPPACIHDEVESNYVDGCQFIAAVQYDNMCVATQHAMVIITGCGFGSQKMAKCAEGFAL